MGGSRNFGQGGSRSICHKKADVFFFFIVFILVLQWFISKKTIISQVSRRGPTFYSGWGSNCLFPIDSIV